MELDWPHVEAAIMNATIPIQKTMASRGLGLRLSPRRVAADAPHMHAIMKSAKMMPCGGGISLFSSAGVQLKTKAYIEPSKQATITHINATFLSVTKRCMASLTLFTALVASVFCCSDP